MGAGRSGLFSGTTGGKSTIESNAKAMSKKYPMTHGGYFGQHGKSKRVRVIYSNDPIETAKDFYERISKGGVYSKLSNGHGEQALLSDKSRIVFRIHSKSGSPAVEIFIINANGVKEQKIHFEERKK